MIYAICPVCNANLAAGALHAPNCQHAATHNLGDSPIQERHLESMRELGRSIDTFLNPQRIENPTAERTTGFVLIVSDFVDGGDARCNYLSNIQRQDVIVMLTEQLARFRGMPTNTSSTKQ